MAPAVVAPISTIASSFTLQILHLLTLTLINLFTNASHNFLALGQHRIDHRRDIPTGDRNELARALLDIVPGGFSLFAVLGGAGMLHLLAEVPADHVDTGAQHPAQPLESDLGVLPAHVNSVLEFIGDDDLVLFEIGAVGEDLLLEDWVVDGLVVANQCRGVPK